MGILERFRDGKRSRKANFETSRPIAFEMLEPRLLLSADLSFVALAGQSLDLTLRLEDSRQEIQIIDNTNQIVLHSQVFAETRSVVIRGADKDDKLTIDLSTPFSLPEGITFEDSSASDSDTLEVIGQDNLFNITGKNEGNVNGAIDFAGIENLIGGADTDTFKLTATGSISGTIDGGAGCFDTVEVQEDDYDVVSFDYTGSDSGEIKLDGAVIALYSRMEAITLTSSGRSPPTTVAINILTAASDEFTLRDDGTSGNGGMITIDSVNGTFVDTAFEAPTGSLTVNTGPGNDTIRVEVLNPSFDLSINGEAGSDTLVGPDSDCTWHITGADAGNVAGVDFSYIENLIGAIDNKDTFTIIYENGGISGIVDGGAGGFDTLIVQGGTTVSFSQTTSPDPGTVTLDSREIEYSGFEGFVHAVTGTDNITITAPDSNDDLVLKHDPSDPSDPSTRLILYSPSATIESHSFYIPSTSITIDLGGGIDSLTIENLSIPGVDLSVINSETITVSSGATVTADDISLTASATDAGTLGGLTDADLELDFLNDVILADSTASVDVTGAILNGANITLNATSSLDLDSSGFGMSVLTLAVICAQSNAEVIVENTQITASGNLNISASSDVIASAAIGAVSGTDTKTDAAIAISVVDSSADAHVSGTSQLIVAGDVDISATNTVTVITIADGSTSGAAGASLALSVVKGTTKAYIAGTASINDTDDINEADSVSVTATTISTVTTTAKSTPKGAEKSSGNNETEKKLLKYGAGTSDGSVNIAGALAISDVIRPTEAYISSSNTVVSDGNIDIAATSSNRAGATAEGTATSSTATGVGVAVALNIADIDSKAYIAGAADLTADAVTIDATVAGRQWLFDPSTAVNNIDDTIDLGAPHGFRTGDTVVYSSGEGSSIANLTDGETYYVIVDSTSPNTVKLATTEQNAKDGVAINLDTGATGYEHSLTEKESRFYAEATSGAGGSGNVGVAGSLAINVVMVDTDAYIDNGASVNVHGADVNINASSKTKSTVKALPKGLGVSGGTLADIRGCGLSAPPPPPIIELNIQPLLCASFPPACEPPASSFAFILALPILTLNPCSLVSLLSQQARASPEPQPAQPQPKT